MKQQAYQTSGLTESLVAFAQFLRSHGFNAGILETQEALRAAALGIIGERTVLKHALKAIFCHAPEERNAFETLFQLYWDTNPIDLEVRKGKTSVQGTFNKKANASLVMLGQGKNDLPEEEEARQVSGANATERLKKTDLAKLHAMDAEALDEIAKKLCRQMAVRMRRRMRQSAKQEQLNLRRTIRKSISMGGEPIDLSYRQKSPKKQRLIVLLDVSGSMDKYSFFLLRFICALRDHFRQLEGFIFSTKLLRISKALKPQHLGQVLQTIGSQADHWSGGTQIGKCLQDFTDQYGKRLLNGSPVVLILSDGLDTGEPEALGKALRSIRQRSKRLIWLNPLKGMQGYEPTARGMQAALPNIDDFRTAHNLESLLELENLLIHA